MRHDSVNPCFSQCNDLFDLTLLFRANYTRPDSLHTFISLKLGENVSHSRNGLVDILLSMCEGGEACLVLGGSEVNTPLEHHAVELRESLTICVGSSVLEAKDGLFREEEAEHTYKLIERHGNIRTLCSQLSLEIQLTSHRK
jgi:hypothetical protein